MLTQNINISKQQYNFQTIFLNTENFRLYHTIFFNFLVLSQLARLCCVHWPLLWQVASLMCEGISLISTGVINYKGLFMSCHLKYHSYSRQLEGSTCSMITYMSTERLFVHNSKCHPLHTVWRIYNNFDIRVAGSTDTTHMMSYIEATKQFLNRKCTDMTGRKSKTLGC